MNCEEFTNRLWKFFEGKLSDEELRECEQHMGACSSCDALVEKCRELTCRDLIRFIDDYLEGRLTENRHAVFERHLSVCPDCCAYLDGYRKTSAVSASALKSEPEALPPDLIRAVLDSWTQKGN